MEVSSMTLGKSMNEHARRWRLFFRHPRLEILEHRTLLSFIDAATYPVGSFPAFVAVGDFNGDGAQDLAVANEQSNTVTIPAS
jgi:hypothetical protein